MTEVLIVSSPAILTVLYRLAKYTIRCIFKYQYLKMLLDAGVEHGEITDDLIKF